MILGTLDIVRSSFTICMHPYAEGCIYGLNPMMCALVEMIMKDGTERAHQEENHTI